MHDTISLASVQQAGARLDSDATPGQLPAIQEQDIERMTPNELRAELRAVRQREQGLHALLNRIVDQVGDGLAALYNANGAARQF
jgi:hypothetical protein